MKYSLRSLMSMSRFSVRDLFWAILVVGLGLGWWVHARQMKAELASTQSDLLYQADLVETFSDVLTQLGCELRADFWQAQPNRSGIYYSEEKSRLEKGTAGQIASTEVPREELQRTLDDEFGKRFRHSPSVQAARAEARRGRGP